MYATIPGENKHTLLARPRDLREWARPQEGEIMIFPRYNWWNNILRIASIDRNTRIVTLAGNASYPIRPNDRYYFRNLFEELDAPGEWYLDRETWTLYFWPPAGMETAPVYAPTLDTIVAIQGAKNIVLRGFTIECCEGAAVVVRDSTECLVAGNTIRNVGGRCSWAIRLLINGRVMAPSATTFPRRKPCDQPQRRRPQDTHPAGNTPTTTTSTIRASSQTGHRRRLAAWATALA